MSAWLTVILAGVGTYLIRVSFVVALQDIEVPELVQRALRYVPPAVLAALSIPPVVAPDGQLGIIPPAPEFLAAIVAAVVAWRTKNLAATIVVGIPVLIGLEALLG